MSIDSDILTLKPNLEPGILLEQRNTTGIFLALCSVFRFQNRFKLLNLLPLSLDQKLVLAINITVFDFLTLTARAQLYSDLQSFARKVLSLQE